MVNLVRLLLAPAASSSSAWESGPPRGFALGPPAPYRARAWILALAVALLPWPTGAGAAETFQPDDQIISDPAADIPDPEFDSIWNRMVWQDPDRQLWVADVDPFTGAITPSDGKGVLVDTGLYPGGKSGNGPEWVYGDETVSIAYTRSVDGSPVLGAAKIQQGAWVPITLEEQTKRWRAFGTLDPSGKPGVVYVKALGGGKRAVAWRDLDNADTERSVKVTGQGGRWVDGKAAFVALNEVNGVQQVVEVNADTGEVTQITTDCGDKLAPSMWLAPEYGDFLLSTSIERTTLGIYRRVNGQWKRWNEITLPSKKPFISSPEPFVAGGKSYVVMVAAQELGGKGVLPFLPVGPTEVWIAGVAQDAPFFRRVDDPSTEANRSEPEIFFRTRGPVVMYTQKDDASGRRLLRRATTGLGP